jgi:nucleoside-diphosphate-sugar epimerase
MSKVRCSIRAWWIEALSGVDEVYYLAGLLGMWIPHKNNSHDVNCRGTEVVIAAARKRGSARFLHCSTESILFRFSPSEDAVAEDTCRRPTTFRVHIPARKCSRNGSQCKLRHLVFRWSLAVRQCQSGPMITT